ncbi:DNA-binding NtrC family response regulator [Bradyrhizobium sp. LM6.10]
MEAIPLVGRSPAMQEIYRVLARLMQTDLTVMITGESGTGKELVARALHDYGKRRNGPFVAVNMAAIPRDLIESELFGHERGAFTGANTRASGRFEQAEGGTLFLDEIGDMPMEAQTRLLRVLQQGEYTTVGGRTPIKTDVRIVAASNKDLRVLIQQGLFREDLFFRLNVVPLRLPPLRERIEDLPDLIRHFFALAEKDGLPPKKLDTLALERMKQHRWPGNVRELENLARRLAALYPQDVITGSVIDGELAPPTVSPGAAVQHGVDNLGGAVEAYLSSHFQGFPNGVPPPGPLSPHPQGDRGAAAHGRARRHPRQPDTRRRSARPQPQHAAEEDPGSRYPGLSKRGLAFPERTVAQLPLPKRAEPVRIALAVMADAVGRSPDWTEMFRWNIENGHSAAGCGLTHYLTSRPVIGIMLATFAGGTCKPGPLTRRSAATISSSTADTIIAR